MIVKVDFDYDADYMECPDSIEMESMIKQFDEWIHDPANDHPFWTDEDHIAVCYRADAIVYWLNHYVLENSKQKAKILEEMIREERKFDYTIVL